MQIHIWGAMENAILRTVDREGQIFLPTVGPVKVWGLTFSQSDRLIREYLSRYFRGFETSVSLGRLRTKRIYVVGEVRQPGSYTVSSLSTMINALFAAGGPTKLGSLRKVELKRNQHTTETLDLYDFLLRGDKTHDFRLQNGDTIFIPPVGPVASFELPNDPFQFFNSFFRFVHDFHHMLSLGISSVYADVIPVSLSTSHSSVQVMP